MLRISSDLKVCNNGQTKLNNLEVKGSEYIGTQNPINLDYHPNAINRYNINFKGYIPAEKNIGPMKEFADFIKQEAIKKIAIFTHFDPDHDAIGSAVAIKELLKAKGKEATIFVMKPLKHNAKFLDENKEIVVVNDLKNSVKPGEPISMDQLKELYGLHDGIVIVDGHSIDRIDKKLKTAFIDPVKELVIKEKQEGKNIKGRVTIIDHHLEEHPQVPSSNDKYFSDLNPIKIIDSSVESASRLCMQLVGAFDLKPTKTISDAIYAGITSDSYMLNHAKKGSGIGNDIAELEKTSDLGELTKEVNSMLIDDFELTKELMNRVKFTNNKEIGYVTFDKDLMKKCKDAKLCIENAVINIATQFSRIRGLKYFFVIKELPNENGKITVSLRSKNGPINSITESYNGGGHAQAGGFSTIVDNVETFKDELIQKLNALHQ